MSLIIVEGPDGAGKSTLINAIVRASKSDVVVHHHGAYLGEEYIGLHYFRSVYMALGGADVVMDRSWFAEPIYGLAMRGGSNRMLEIERGALEALANVAKARLVVCLPPFEVCEHTWLSRLEKEYPKKREQLRTVWDGYVSLLRYGRFGLFDSSRVVQYDYQLGGEEELVGRLLA